MKERIIIVIIAVVLGLAATTLGFFIYQSTKVIPDEAVKPAPKTAKIAAAPVDTNKLYLTVDEPNTNTLVTNRTIQVKGKTNPDNTLIVSTNQEDVVATPSSDGNFSISITIDAGTNRLITRAISPGGDEKTDQRVISFSTAEF